MYLPNRLPSALAAIFLLLTTNTMVQADTLISQNNFETGLGVGWVANGWLRDSGQTPSGGTGPNGGANGSNYFAYFETSGSVGTGDVATLVSPTLPPSSIQLEFSYHMYGSSMGSLYAEVLTNGSWVTLWQRTGQQHSSVSAAWSSVSIDLSSYTGSIKIRFRGVDGNSYRGDMAVDNVSITTTETKPSAPENIVIGFDESRGVHVVTWDAPPEEVTHYRVEGSTDEFYASRRLTGQNNEVETWNFSLEDFGDYEQDIDVQAGRYEPPAYGAHYFFNIYAVNDHGETGSERITLRRDPEAPATPTGLVYTSNNNTGLNQFSWGASTTPSGSEVYYELRETLNSGATKTTGHYSTRPTLFASSDGSTNYRVRACSVFVCSAWSSPASLSARPTKVQNLNIEYNTVAEEFFITWKAPPEVVSGYNIYYSVAEFIQKVHYNVGEDNQQTIEEFNEREDEFDVSSDILSFRLPASGEIEGIFEIRARNEVDDGPRVEGRLDVTSDTAPPIPANLSDSVDYLNDRVDYSWDSSGDDIYYELDVVFSGDNLFLPNTLNFTTTSTDFDVALRDGRPPYRFVVRACTRNHCSDWTEIVREPYSGFTEEHQAYVNVTNGVDIALATRTPSVGDVITVLVWDGSKYIPQISTVSANTIWELDDAIKLGLVDFNLDGFLDIYLGNLDSVIPSTWNLNDQIVFANPMLGAVPLAVTEADEDFHQFFEDMSQWMLDPDYFEDMAEYTLEDYSFVYRVFTDTGRIFDAYYEKYGYPPGLSPFTSGKPEPEPEPEPAFKTTQTCEFQYLDYACQEFEDYGCYNCNSTVRGLFNDSGLGLSGNTALFPPPEVSNNVVTTPDGKRYLLSNNGNIIARIPDCISVECFIAKIEDGFYAPPPTDGFNDESGFGNLFEQVKIFTAWANKFPTYRRVSGTRRVIVESSIDNIDAYEFAKAFEQAERNDFSNETDRAELSEDLARVLGVPSIDFDLPRNSMTDIFLGDSENKVSQFEFNIRLFLQGLNVIEIVAGTPNIPLLVLGSDPEEWQPHYYGVESNICKIGTDTVVSTGRQTAGPFGPHTSPVLGTIPAEVCTVENVFCWSKRRPAPRADGSDTSLAINGEREILAGVPFSGRTDPITTWIDEENFTHRNETFDEHLLDDPLQVVECANFLNAPTREDIPERCSYVDRRVFANSDDVIQLSTNGAGFNPVVTVGPIPPLQTFPRTYNFVELNEVGGADIFSGVDAWIQEQLINQGECPRTD